jgi:sugar phosphate permease
VRVDESSAGYRWYVVILLLFVFILSYFDRFILSLLIDPIKKTMGLSDFQMGLLLGPAFSIFHVLVGIPRGWVADRSSRTTSAATTARGQSVSIWPVRTWARARRSCSAAYSLRG